MYLICALTTDHSMQLLSEQWYENTWITGYKPLHYGGLAVYTPSILVRVYQPDHSSMWCFYLRALSLDVCAEVLRFVQNLPMVPICIYCNKELTFAYVHNALPHKKY